MVLLLFEQRDVPKPPGEPEALATEDFAALASGIWPALLLSRRSPAKSSLTTIMPGGGGIKSGISAFGNAGKRIAMVALAWSAAWIVIGLGTCAS